VKENIIKTKSFLFSIKIVNLYKILSIDKREYVMSKQLLRSGTAIGALVRESEHAESKADFIHKLSIALKDANETEYWLDLLYETRFLDTSTFVVFQQDIKELLKILVSIIKTTKQI
jgi:four helix bundle protein